MISRLLALAVVVTLTFLLMKALPGDPFNEEQALPKEIHAALRQHYGLDDPWYKQFGRYVTSILTWDLGPSFRYRDRTVNHIINEGFPVSALLGLEALTLAIGGGLLLGTLGALYKGKWPDHLILLLAALCVSIPSFLLGSFLQYILGLKWGLFPLARWGSFSHSILPAISLAALPCAFIARLIRANLIEVLRQDYIKTARAKGLSERRILLVHAMRNAWMPVITYLGPLTTNILVGSFVVETIFAIPGLGQWFVRSILNRDYTVIMGTTVFYSLLLTCFVTLIDFAYRWLDPRIAAAKMRAHE